MTDEISQTEKPNENWNLVGYARVSTDFQRLDLQLDALKKAGVVDDLIFTDVKSGLATKNREGLHRALKACRPGGALVVWRLDRLGRTMLELITTVERLKERGVAVKSISEPHFDGTTAVGIMMFQLFAILAEFERNLLRERTTAGMEAARARGQKFGRKTWREVISDEMILEFRALVKGGMSIKDALKKVGIKPPTYHKHKAFINDADLSIRNPPIDDIGKVDT